MLNKTDHSPSSAFSLTLDTTDIKEPEVVILTILTKQWYLKYSVYELIS